MCGGHASPHLIRKLSDLGRRREAPAFHQQHHAFLSIGPWHADGNDASLAHGGVGLTGCGLKVLRVYIAAMYHQQVLAPASDVQLTLVQEAEVAGAKVIARGRIVRHAGVKICAGLGVAPVAAAKARPADPDFAHLPWRTDFAVIGLNNSYLKAGQRRATTDQLRCPWRTVWHRLNAVFSQCP